MMTIVYLLVAVAAAAAVYFLFLKKSPSAEALPPREEPPRLAERPAPAATPSPSVADRAAAKPTPAPSSTEPARRAPASATPAPAPAEAPAASVEVSTAAPAPTAAVSVEAPAPRAPVKSLAGERDVASLRRGLTKARSDEGFFGRLRALFGGKKELSADITADLEEALLASDVGVRTTELLIQRVQETLHGKELVDPVKVWDALRGEARRILSLEGRAGAFALPAQPTVVLMVGVNGAGKTTTIGKLATKLQAEGRKVVLAAGDTFRAAAVQQLVVWAERVGCEVVRGKDGADSGAVIFDAIKKAQELGADVVLADTAGRLHTKANLMTEMKKVVKTVGKALDGAPHETLLVLDATNGQNALAQAKEFKDTLELSGLVLTKLDGTAKGGVILGICEELALPVRFIGLGERPDDLHPFVAEDFVEALLGKDGEAEGGA